MVIGDARFQTGTFDCSSITVRDRIRSHIFHHFPIRRCLVVYKCRQISVLEFTRGSLGSFYTAIVRRPLCCFRFYSIVQRGCNRFVHENRRFGSPGCFGESLLTRSNTSWCNLSASFRFHLISQRA